MKSMNRRHFVQNAMASAMALSVRATVIGVPVSFLTTGAVHAAATRPKFSIISQSRRGESINANGPGTYGNNGLVGTIDHPVASQVAATAAGMIGGVNYDARDLEQSTTLNLGGQLHRAANVWSALPQSFLNNLTGFWFRTGANAHPEFPIVRTLMGALKDELGNGTEELASAIAMDIAPSLGTASNKPIVLDGSGSFRGIPIAETSPRSIRSSFTANAGGIPADQFAALYSQTMDSVYADLKARGTPAQRLFLDQNALTQNQAVNIGTELGELLSDVGTNDFIDQIKTAIALIRLQVTPTIVVKHDFSNDNHNDRTLTDEVTETIQSINALHHYWELITQYGLQDDVNFFTLDVFGRTTRRNSTGGRDHFGELTLGLAHGSGFTGGVMGGMVAGERRRETVPFASGINSATGASTNNGDIAPGDTFAAYGKTMMKAAGIDDAQLDVRIPSGKVITGALT